MQAECHTRTWIDALPGTLCHLLRSRNPMNNNAVISSRRVRFVRITAWPIVSLRYQLLLVNRQDSLENEIIDVDHRQFSTIVCSTPVIVLCSVLIEA